jgi:hypothetical protein
MIDSTHLSTVDSVPSIILWFWLTYFYYYVAWKIYWTLTRALKCLFLHVHEFGARKVFFFLFISSYIVYFEKLYKVINYLTRWKLYIIFHDRTLFLMIILLHSLSFSFSSDVGVSVVFETGAGMMASHQWHTPSCSCQSKLRLLFCP